MYDITVVVAVLLWQVYGISDFWKTSVNVNLNINLSVPLTTMFVIKIVFCWVGQMNVLAIYRYSKCREESTVLEFNT